MNLHHSSCNPNATQERRVECVISSFAERDWDRWGPIEIAQALDQHANGWWNSLTEDQRYAIFVRHQGVQ